MFAEKTRDLLYWRKQSPDERMAEARQRIFKEALTESGELDLSLLYLSEIPGEIFSLSELVSLNLAGNDIEAAQIAELARLPALSRLDLRDNWLGDEGAHAVASLSGLDRLSLGGNDIGDAGAGRLAALGRLSRLQLGGNRIGDEGAGALAELANLTCLDLWENRVGDEGILALSALTGLACLDLGCAQDADGGPLTRLAGLRELRLSGCHFEQVDAVFWLRESWRIIVLRHCRLAGVPAALLSTHLEDNCLGRLQAHLRAQVPDVTEYAEAMQQFAGPDGDAFLCDRLAGRFTRLDLAERLGGEASELQRLLDGMGRAALCFPLLPPLDDADEMGVYLAPGYLPGFAELRPELELALVWDDGLSDERARFGYAASPAPLLGALMCRIGERAGINAEYWREGFCLFDEGTQARAHVEARDGELLLRASDGDASRLLGLLMRLVEEEQGRLELRPVTVEPPQWRIAPAGGAALAALRPGQAPIAQPERYLSYARGTELGDRDRRRMEAIERLCQDAERQGHHIVRERNQMTFGDRLWRFLQRLGPGKQVVVVLSPKYLRSPFCVHELFAICRHSLQEPEAMRRHLRLYLLPDTGIDSEQARGEHVRFWENELKAGQALRKLQRHSRTREEDRAYRLTRGFAPHFGDMLDYVVQQFESRPLAQVEQLTLAGEDD